MRVRKTKREFLHDILNKYLDEHSGERSRMADVATWAIQNDLWHPPRSNNVQACAKELSAAARQEMYTDPQGRVVRKKHVVRIEDNEGQLKFLWADIEDAPPDHMRLSISQRRGGILGDCKQLKTDLESWNDNNKHGVTLQANFNFQDDLNEMDQPTDYPDAPPDED